MENNNTNKTFEQLYESTKDPVLRYIAAHCCSISDIEDLYQETYLSLHGTLSKKNVGIENDEAFVKTIAKRTISRYYSVASKVRARLSVSLDELREKRGDSELTDSVDIEEDICTDELYSEIYELIEKLSVETQRLIYLRYRLQLSYDDIAKEMNISASAANQRVNKALAQIRRLYTRRNNK